MRANANIFWIIGVFFLLSAAAYTIWVGITVDWDINQIEWVGTVGMGLSAILSFFLAVYLNLVHRAQGGELPQDVETAEIDDDDPELGHFSPWSWWPLVLGGGLAILFLGLAVGPWVCFIGAPLALIGVIGWNYEYYRNNFAR